MNFVSSVDAYELRSKIFGGYKKASHTEYKFDNVPEQVLTIVPNKDVEVIKGLPHAPK